MPAPPDHGERAARSIGMLLLLASSLASLALLVWAVPRFVNAVATFTTAVP